jgi:hypothetical protein
VELKEEKTWNQFLVRSKIGSNAQFDRLLTKAMVHLQRESEKKGLSKAMKHEIRGWGKIAKRLNMSITTAQKIAKDETARMPITLIGGVPVTTEEKMSKWLDDLIENRPYWAIAKEKGMVRHNKCNIEIVSQSAEG